MANEDPLELWQSQQVEPMTMSLEELRTKTARFESCIRSRNRRETVASIFSVALFAFYFFWIPTPLARLGSCLTILGLLYVVYYMNAKGTPAKAPAEAGFETCVEFRRRELERQRDLLRSVWLWYMLPWLPGMLLFFVGAIAAKIHHTSDWWKAAPIGLVLALACWFLLWRNRRGADKLQRMIDELDAW